MARQEAEGLHGKHPGDFVWAVRLAKVHKGFLMTDWSIDAYTKRATMDTGGESSVDLEGVLKEEGMDNFTIIYDEQQDEAFVIEQKVK